VVDASRLLACMLLESTVCVNMCLSGALASLRLDSVRRNGGKRTNAGSDNLRMSLLLSLREAEVGQLQYLMCIIFASEGNGEERLTYIPTRLMCVKPHV